MEFLILCYSEMVLRGFHLGKRMKDEETIVGKRGKEREKKGKGGKGNNKTWKRKNERNITIFLIFLSLKPYFFTFFSF